MFYFPPGIKVHLALGSTDMRKSINGLSMLVEERFRDDPFSGHLFVFCNRRRDIIKVLYWDLNGYCLWQKRLERDRFRWPESEGEVLSMDVREFKWLLDGLDFEQKGAYRRLRYNRVT